MLTEHVGHPPGPPNLYPNGTPILIPQPPARLRLPATLARAIKVAFIGYYGGVCQGCGYKFSKELTPQQLGASGSALELDHRVPLTRNGDNSVENLWLLCIPCHDGKTNRTGANGLPVNMTEDEWIGWGKPQNWDRKNYLQSQRRAKQAQFQAQSQGQGHAPAQTNGVHAK